MNQTQAVLDPSRRLYLPSAGGAQRHTLYIMMDDPQRITVPQLSEGDRLFVTHDETGWATACLNFGSPEHGYVKGYQKAADLAVDHVVAADSDQDYLVFPIVYCYRQYLELRTKGLLVNAGLLLDREVPEEKVLGRHLLRPVWAELAPLLHEVFGPDPQIGLNGNRIAEFDALDPASMAFRYATDKKGRLSLPGDLYWLSLTNLRSTIEKMASSLDGWDMGLDYYLEQKAEQREFLAEQEREFRGSFEDEHRSVLADEARYYGER
jgi:hypothetical protein